MSSETHLMAEIALEIERLRQEFTDTQDLYREVCVMLFFRHGVAPTANKLYQLVRKGSMSAPTEALRKFWADLREKSRVRIEQPDLPEALKSATGEMAAALWKQAQEAADQNLFTLHEKASASVLAAQEAQRTAESEAASLQDALGQSHGQLVEAQQRILELERQSASEQTGKESALAELEKSGIQIKSLEQALSDVRREFAAELEKQREALERSEARMQGSEKRALLEIDRERTGASRLQKELEQLRQVQHDEAERHHAAIIDYQTRESELRQSLGQAEGVAQSQKETSRELAAQLESSRLLLKSAEKRQTALEVELDARIKRIQELEEQLVAFLEKSSTKPPKRSRRTSTFQD